MQNNMDGLEATPQIKCEKCGSEKLKYLGIGEYKCENCGELIYDEYGRVRNYLEKNPGATQAEVSRATGIPGSVIRRLLIDDKIQIAPGSTIFMHCEICGAEIRSGRVCDACSKKRVTDLSQVAKKLENTHIIGGLMKKKNEGSGAMRFNREK